MDANHKPIFRLYQNARLAVKRRRNRHSVAVERKQLALPSRLNQVWSADFVNDALSSGRRIKVLTLVGDIHQRGGRFGNWLWQFKLIEPGKPTQNAFIKSFDSPFRDEYLDDHWFTGLAEARVRIVA
jgi:putative transposase